MPARADTPDLSPSPPPATPALVSIPRVAAPIVDHLTGIVLGSVVVAAVVAAFTFLSTRKYEAPLAFSTLQSAKASALSSLPSAIFSAALGTGLQPTPALLSRLVTSENVRVNVARAVVPGRHDSTVADMLLGKDSRAVTDAKVAQALGKVVATNNDRETGLVTVSTTHADSALARFITDQVVAEVTTAFQHAVKSQATDTRASLTQRFDTAEHRLRLAEQAAQEFSATNRTVPPYSPAAILRDRLTRELALAQTLYDQVQTERESAKQKELEDTPAVVIVDPLPRQLIPVSKQTAIKSAAAFIVAFGLFGLFAVLRDLLRPPADTPATDGQRLVQSLYRNRLLRWTVASRVTATPRSGAA